MAEVEALTGSLSRDLAESSGLAIEQYRDSVDEVVAEGEREARLLTPRVQCHRFRK